MQPDLVSIVESIYQIEDDPSSWLGRILERLAPWVGDGVGLFGFTYAVTPAFEIRPDAFAAVDCPDESLRVLPRAATLHAPEFIRAGYVVADLGVGSAIPGWHGSEGREYAVRAGIADVWAINGRNPGNRGCSLIVNRKQEGLPGPRDRDLLVRIAAHVAAANRLRQRLERVDASERAEAILASNGKIQHAVGDAKARGARDDLRAAARALDLARTKLRQRDQERAVDIWKPLVSARWTLVDHFESDGRRYILAQENEPDPRGAADLSSRERQVLANLALGRSSKETAYALGLAHSTVRVLLARAAKKLGASSRRQLIERYRTLAAPDRKRSS